MKIALIKDITVIFIINNYSMNTALTKNITIILIINNYKIFSKFSIVFGPHRLYYYLF